MARAAARRQDDLKLYELKIRRLDDGELARLKTLIAENKSQNEAARAAENAEAREHLKYSFEAAAQKKFYEAEINLLYAIEKHPQNSTLVFHLANLYFSLGRNDEAEKQYHRAVKMSPLFYLAYVNLGVLYVHETKYKAAEKCFEKALLIDGKKPAAYLNLANLYYWQGSGGDAEKYYLNTLKLDPKSRDAALNLARLYVERREYERAEEVYGGILPADRQNPDLLCGLAEAFFLQKEYARATALCEQIREIKLDHGDNHILLAKIYLALDKLDLCERSLRVAEEICPYDSRLHRWWGNLYTAKGQFHLAAQSFKRALALNPHCADTAADYAQSLDLAGKPREAEKVRGA